MSAILDALQLGPVRWQVWLGWSYLYSKHFIEYVFLIEGS